MPRTIKNKGIQGGFDIRGDKEIRDILENILPREANNLMRSTMDGVASEIKKRASSNARNLGLSTVGKAIKNKRKKSPPEKPTSIVFVEHGTGAKNDAWYWHFHEFGTAQRFTQGKPSGRITERPFIRPARDLIFMRLKSTIREQFQLKLRKRVAAVKKRKAQK